MRQFCYRCGALKADAGPLIHGLCQRCFLEQSRLLQTPSEVEVVVCKRCGAYMLGRRWRVPLSGRSVENAVRETALDSTRVIRMTESGTQLLRPQEAQEVEITIEPNLKAGLVKVRALGKAHELQAKPKLEEATLKLNITYKTCDICGLKRARYHEAILQVRGELSRDELQKVKGAIEGLASASGERGDFIAEVQQQRGGLDIYVSSVGLARRLASLLKEKFGASISESAKLIGQTRDGRQKFKVTIIARLGRG